MAKPETGSSISSANTAGEAVWPGKQAWKNEPGNRYTPDQLREMERHWDVKIFDPTVVEIHRVD